ncbi:MAG: hypothetical protein NTV34_07205 [Proteobacteria bacterium]|nr:hypothetical protein [Pseudomonadota bacterium]
MNAMSVVPFLATVFMALTAQGFASEAGSHGQVTDFPGISCAYVEHYEIRRDFASIENIQKGFKIIYRPTDSDRRSLKPFFAPLTERLRIEGVLTVEQAITGVELFAPYPSCFQNDKNHLRCELAKEMAAPFFRLILEEGGRERQISPTDLSLSVGKVSFLFSGRIDGEDDSMPPGFFMMTVQDIAIGGENLPLHTVLPSIVFQDHVDSLLKDHSFCSVLGRN